MSETKENLTRIRAVRGGNRGVITKLINEAEGLLKEEILERGRLNTITSLLEEKLKYVKDLDQKIIEICEVADIAAEIDEAEELISRVLDTQRHILEKIREVEEVQRVQEIQSKSPSNVHTNTANEEPISVNVRGLEALGVDSSQYGSLLIPVVMSKLPQDVRLQIARNTAQDVWEMSELLSVILKEVEAREISDGIKVTAEKGKIPPTKPPPHGSAAALLANGQTFGNKIQCVYCSGNHFSASCTQTSEVQARLEILKRDRRCFVCLKRGHRSNQCSNQRGCRRCNGRHHQSICNQQITKTKPNVEEQAAPTNGNEGVHGTQTLQQIQNRTENPNPNTHTVHVQSTTATTIAKGHVMLQTATAVATNVDGSKSSKVKILFDSGSQRSYITEGLKSRLNLEPRKTETLHLNTFGERSYRKQKCEVSPLVLRSNKNEDVIISALSFPVICSPLITKIEVDQYPHLQGLQLADSSDSNDSIDVLIGSDHYWDLVEGDTVRGEFGPVAIDSKFGWLLSGPTNNDSFNEICTTNLVILGSSDNQSETTQDPLVDMLRKFWETESIGIKGDPEPKEFIESFNESVHFNGKRYQVELPWKQDCPSIPSDYQLCENRLRSLHRKMLQQPELLQEYDQIIQQQIQDGIVEKVPDEEIEITNDESVNYLPHHGVIRRDRETTKLRIVYDGSAKPPDREYSLNDCLETGPNFIPQLFDTLVKFRWHRIGLTADIEKAFLMVAINDLDKDMLRFLWLKEPNNLSSELVQLRFTRLVFGLRPSPAILSSTIRHHLETQKDVDPQLIELLKKSLYVDDFVSGADNEKEASEVSSNAKLIMRKGAFNLRKWNTNSSNLKKTFANQSSPNATNVKGVTEEDESYAKTVTATTIKPNDNTTKISAKIFDPLGLLSPFTIQWKVLFQLLCNENIEWDDELIGEHLNKWNLLILDLQSLSNVCVPRCYFEIDGKVLSIQVHCFSDASEKAYAAAIYLRSKYESGLVDVNLIAAKTRVAPLKRQTIPRLELLGANILARLANNIQNALELPQDVEIYYWVDSKTVLYWIKNAKPWKQYVLTRVKEIRECTAQDSWRHCPGLENPADLPSRGMNANKLVNEKRWWEGPEFLYKSETEWPKKVENKENEASMNEVVKNPTTVTHTLTNLSTESVRLFSHANIGAIMDCNEFHSKTKLLRVTTMVLRAVRKMKRIEVANESEQLNAENLKEAEMLWLKSIQLSEFSEEIRRLNSSHKNPNQLINQLNLYLDVEKIIRCKGRLEYSTISTEAKEPILLPSRHHFTKLIIEEEHKRVHHNGIKSTLNGVRESYWILRGRETVKRVLKGCVICKKIEGKAFQTPREPSLPSCRVSDEPPFTNIGVDFAGPLLVKEGDKTVKSYICLFTCASTRAVHLELLKDLSTNMFLTAFRRFISRRGMPRKILTDNAKTFKAAAKEVTKIYHSNHVKRYLADNGISWEFITEKAPWHGGFWERLIKSIKRCLKKQIGRTSSTFEELRTILVEIEATLNNRPLTYIYDDEQGVSYPLTPASLIYGRRISTAPNDSQHEIMSTNKSLTRRAKYQARVLKNFSDQWRKEYLLSIRESSRAQNSGSNVISVGDVVTLKNDSTSRIYWRLAKVENLLRSKDGVIRSAEVRVLSNDNKKTVVLRRPIQHLIPLEVQGTSKVQSSDEVQDASEVQVTSESQIIDEIKNSSEAQGTSKVQTMDEVQDTNEIKRQSDTRPRRKAAVNAELIRRTYQWR
ncbi:uncharacterized protein LOC114536361 [Dendronephthya gigantea]|uniref:uncharacterized protein LOC114536361 n=1 Tax=Dendronephthya gigantea TaxID=151771 RepID=UPI001069518B|nr:uncharacterized protein LOC114536361 [Dendronephthya gigantea]